MNDERTTGYLPEQVSALLNDIQQNVDESAVVKQVNERRWEIPFTMSAEEIGIAETTVTVSIQRTSSGRISKPTATVKTNGVTRHIKDWQLVRKEIEKNTTNTTVIPPAPAKSSIDKAPSQVRKQYEALVHGVGSTAEIQVGRSGDSWVISIDGQECRCGKVICLKCFAVRMHYRRKGKGQSWKPDSSRFFAAVGGLDLSDQWRHQLSSIVALLVRQIPGTSMPAAPTGGHISSSPATQANSVTERRNAVRRN